MENEAGALSRVINLISARGFNIESLTVAPTQDPSLSRLTLVTKGTEQIVEQIVKQLNKLVDVIKLIDLTEGDHIERELMLVKVRYQDHDHLHRLVDIFRGRVVDVSNRTYTIELTGAKRKLDAFLNAVESSSIIEMVRTGITGLSRGSKAMRL